MLFQKLLGHLIDCIFHGAFLVQVCMHTALPEILACLDNHIPSDIYFVTFPQDKRKLKIFVLILMMLENIQTGLVLFDAVTAFGDGFGDIDSLTDVRMQWLSVPVLSAFSKS